MKTKLLSCLLCVFFLCVGLSSCGEEDYGNDYGRAIAGTYTGKVSLNRNSSVPLPNNVKLKVTRLADDKVELSINEKIVAITLNLSTEAKVTKQDNVYYLEGSEIFEMPNPFLPEQTTMFHVNVEGTVKEKKIDLSIDLEGDNSMALLFVGSK